MTKIKRVIWDAPFTGATRMSLYNELFVATRLMVIDMVEREEHLSQSVFDEGEPLEDVFRVIHALNAIEGGTINAE